MADVTHLTVQRVKMIGPVASTTSDDDRDGEQLWIVRGPGSLWFHVCAPDRRGAESEVRRLYPRVRLRSGR